MITEQLPELGLGTEGADIRIKADQTAERLFGTYSDAMFGKFAALRID